MPNDSVDATVNQESYTDNGDGTVTDNVTGLMWQKAVPTTSTTSTTPMTFAWSAAVSYCPTLRLATHNDWRLPTEIELASLIDDSGAGISANINNGVFPNTPSTAFWSSTPLAGSSSAAWFVDFTGGSGNTATGAVTVSYAVRCVR
jgi:hypothetical protein